MFSAWSTNGISRKLQPGNVLPGRKTFSSPGIGEIRQAQLQCCPCRLDQKLSDECPAGDFRPGVQYRHFGMNEV